MPKAKITNIFTRNAKCPNGKRKEVYSDTTDIGFILEVRHTGTKTYYYRYSKENKIKHIKIADSKDISATKAREKMLKLKKDIKSKENTIVSSLNENSNVITLGEFYLHYYLPFIKTSKKSFKQDMSFYQNHILPIWKHVSMNKLTRTLISQKHISLVQDNGLSPNTANKLLSYLSYTFNLAIDWEIEGILVNPVSKIKPLEVTNIVERFLTKEETKRLIKSASKVENPYIKPIIEFLILTGARKQEVLSAQWKHIDLINKLWTIPLTKSGKIRRVPIPPQLENVILNLKKESDHYLFPSSYTNKPIVNFSYHWYKVIEDAKLNNLRVHDLRHSYASALINNGRSLYEVQLLLGHSNVKVTQRYAHLSQNSLYEAALCASKLFE